MQGIDRKVSAKESIAIIPVCASDKYFDTQVFRGLPLFLWSIFYADEEGIPSIVVTDSDTVEHTAKGFGALVYRREDEGCSDYDIILKIIQDIGSREIICLRPTVPFHKAGVIAGFLQQLRRKEVESCYTASCVLMEGNFQGKFIRDTTEEMWSADGNLMGCTAEYFLAHGNYFIGEDSKIFRNELPYSCRINTREDFNLLESLAKGNPELLVHNVRTICCVPNIWSIKRNYAQFVDSCDLVVRSGKLDSIDTGYTGKRADVVAVSTSQEWHQFSEQEQHITEINAAPLVFMNMDSGGEIPDTFNHWYPVFYGESNDVEEAVVAHMSAAFPDSTVYTFRPKIKGNVVDIDEEGKPETSIIYSTKPEWYMHIPEKIRVFHAVRNGDKPDAYIYPWKRRMVIPEKGSAVAQAATVLRWNRGKDLVIHWDNSDDIERYSKSYANFYKKTDVLKKEDVSLEAALMAMVPLHYTSIWTLGQASLARLFLEAIDPDALTGLFDKVWVPNLPTAVDLLCKRGEDWLTRASLATDGTLKGALWVYDRRKGHAFLEDFIREENQVQAMDEQFSTVEGRYHRKWERMLKVLDDPLEKPLFIYTGVGKLLHNTRNKPRFTNVQPGMWFSLETAYDYYWKLRHTFKADISLAYFDIPEDPKERVADIIYSENNFLAATYNVALKPRFKWVTDAVGVQFGEALTSKIFKVQELHDNIDGLDYESVICREGETRDIYYINEDRFEGYSMQDGELQPITVDSYIRGVELKICTASDKVKTYKKGAHTVEYIYVADTGPV